MAKTKILNDLEQTFKGLLQDAVALQAAFETRASGWKGKLGPFENSVENAKKEVAAAEAYMQKWDNPTLKSKIKNALKDKSKLEAARAQAREQVTGFGDLIQDYERVIKEIKKWRLEHEGAFLP